MRQISATSAKRNSGNAPRFGGQRRAGYTLIEVLVVVSVMSVLMLLTSTTLFSLYASHRRLNERTGLQATLSRLSLQLRSDAHAAREASAGPAADGMSTTITLRLNDDLAVDYQSDSAGVRRTVRRQGQPVHRELFRLGPLDRAHWQLTEADDSRRIVLRIRTGADLFVETKELDAASDPTGDTGSDAAGDVVSDYSAPPDLLRVEVRLGLLPGEVPLDELEADTDSTPAADTSSQKDRL